METKANHILIGSFVVLVLAAGFGFLYWFNNLGSTSARSYAILFDGSVGGLSPASNVTFNGIQAGKVRRLKIYPQDTRKVLVIVSVRGDIPVRVNSRARILQQGLTGFSAIDITAGSPDAPILAAIEGQDYPLIKADRGRTDSLMSAAPEVLGNANAVFLRLNDLIANNEDSIRDTIKNVQSFTKMLDENKDQVAVIIADAKDLAARLKVVAGKLETATEKVSSFLAEDENSVIAEVRQAVASFRELAKKLEKSVGDNAANVMKTAQESMKEFDLFMREGRRAAQSLDRVLEKIDRNPQSFIFGGSSVPEYNPGQ